MDFTNFESVKAYLLALQEKLTHAFQNEDATCNVTEDNWTRKEGGGGRTRILSGDVIEKAGINFSHVFGEKLPPAATLNRPEIANHPFQAVGISVIIHPRNPYVPTCHANFRFFLSLQEGEPIWWFGGGFDLTPYYPFLEDCVHWHKTAKEACDPFGAELYPQYKKWADDYFHLKHRNEARGIGGIFYDDVNQWDFEKCFAFLRSTAEHFIKAYLPILQRRKNISFNESEKKFQLHRRGRYVEFNLIYDRGTLFGLQSNGRTESILASLPPEVTWEYNFQPRAGSPEAKLCTDFLVAKDWLATT